MYGIGMYGMYGICMYGMYGYICMAILPFCQGGSFPSLPLMSVPSLEPGLTILLLVRKLKKHIDSFHYIRTHCRDQLAERGRGPFVWDGAASTRPDLYSGDEGSFVHFETNRHQHKQFILKGFLFLLFTNQQGGRWWPSLRSQGTKL